MTFPLFLCALMRFDHQVWFGDGGIRQAFHITDRTILRPQFINRPEFNRFEWTGCHTDGLLSLRLEIHAEITFGHLPGLLVELWRAVRARPRAVAAADALISINAHNAVSRTLVHRRGRTVFSADWVCTVVTGNRERVGKHIVADAALPGWDEIPAIDFINATETTSDLKVVFIFARHLACLAARAARRVDIKTQLFVAHRCVMFKLTHALATSTSMV